MSRGGLRLVVSAPRPARERPVPRTASEAGYPADAVSLSGTALDDALGDLDRSIPSPDDALPRLLVDAVVIFLAQTLVPADVVRLALRPDVRARHLAALDAARAAAATKAKA